jgi:hypothetical protein
VIEAEQLLRVVVHLVDDFLGKAEPLNMATVSRETSQSCITG